MCCRTTMNVYNQNPLVDYYPLIAMLADALSSGSNCNCGCGCSPCSGCGCNG